MNKIKAVSDQLVREFQPEKVILFGSWAWGTPGPDSDVDFFIVKETNNTRTTAREIDGSIFPRPFPLDIVVYRPKEANLRMRKGNLFIRNIFSKGKVLYAK